MICTASSSTEHGLLAVSKDGDPALDSSQTQNMASPMKIGTVGIVGAGAWGTSLAQTVCKAGLEVILWAHEREVVAEINARHTNGAFLPGVTLDPSIGATAALADLGRSGAVLIVAPAQHVRSMAASLASHIPPGVPIVCCAKGIEQATGALMGEVLAQALPGHPLAVLSGPSFASEVARGLPAALTLGCRDEALARSLVESLSHRQFRLYASTDIKGVDLGGAVKNVLAIAAGIVAGKELGASAHAALVTRGFAELRRFGLALGARPETLMGLSGLGDLILTCGSPQSRNMSLGAALGKGRKLAEVLSERRAVTEGVYTAAAVVKLARERDIEMPISEAVAAIVSGTSGVDEAIEALMQRPLKVED